MNFSAVAVGLVIGLTAASTVAQSPNAQEKTVVKEGIGCQDFDFMLRMEKYISQNDTEVIRREVLRALQSGACTFFKAGERVYMADASIFGPKIRRKGESEEFWVPFSVLTGVSEGSLPKAPEAGTRTLPKVQRGGQ